MPRKPKDDKTPLGYVECGVCSGPAGIYMSVKENKLYERCVPCQTYIHKRSAKGQADFRARMVATPADLNPVPNASYEVVEDDQSDVVPDDVKVVHDTPSDNEFDPDAADKAATDVVQDKEASSMGNTIMLVLLFMGVIGGGIFKAIKQGNEETE